MSRNTRIGLIVLIALALVVLAYLIGRRSKEAALVASPSPTVSASPTSAPTVEPTVAIAGTQRCHTSDLSLALGQSQGAAGTSYETADLINKSNHDCTLYGYPGVSVLDASGKQLGQPAVRSGATPAIVMLAPGQSSHVNIGFPNAGNFAPGTCSALTTTLRIYPPDETTALTTALEQQNCPGFSVSAVMAGASG